MLSKAVLRSPKLFIIKEKKREEEKEKCHDYKNVHMYKQLN